MTLFLRLTLIISSILSVSACSESTQNTPATKITISNANTYAKLGYQQLIALHSQDLLTRNTAVNQPIFTNPCSNNGGYSFTKTDINNNTAFDTGDSVTETYSNCAYNLGDMSVSGSVTSTVTKKSNAAIDMNVQHNNLSITVDGQTYTYNGTFKTSLDTDNILTQMTNEYTGYTVNFRGHSTRISAGRSIATLHILQDTYTISQTFVFTGSSFEGIFRSDTAGGIQGTTTTNNKNIYPFRGLLRIESTTGEGSVSITSEDDDNDASTYSRDVRFNRVTTKTEGLLWDNLLIN